MQRNDIDCIDGHGHLPAASVPNLLCGVDRSVDVFLVSGQLRKHPELLFEERRSEILRIEQQRRREREQKSVQSSLKRRERAKHRNGRE